MEASLVYKLKRFVYLTPLSKSHMVHWLRFKLRKSWNLSVIKKFGRENEVETIFSQMKRAYVKFRWNAEEFFLFRYEKLTDKQRAEFCPEFDHNAFCLSINNWQIAQDFRDKWKTYLRFKPFFKRECILINSITDLDGEAFANFRAQNPVFLMKALDMCCGRGIQKIENTDIEPIRTFVLGGGVNAS